MRNEKKKVKKEKKTRTDHLTTYCAPKRGKKKGRRKRFLCLGHKGKKRGEGECF